jgi:hypothetical protein
MKEHVSKIISGGQTGVDQGALEAAKEIKIPTGGCLPKNCITERGPNVTLKLKYNMYESTSSDYRVRTEENIKKSDGTILITSLESRGSDLTRKICEKTKKPYISIDSKDPESHLKIRKFVENLSLLRGRKVIVNVAGNRESKSPGIGEETKRIIKKSFLCN